MCAWLPGLAAVSGGVLLERTGRFVPGGKRCYSRVVFRVLLFIWSHQQKSAPKCDTPSIMRAHLREIQPHRTARIQKVFTFAHAKLYAKSHDTRVSRWRFVKCDQKNVEQYCVWVFPRLLCCGSVVHRIEEGVLVIQSRKSNRKRGGVRDFFKLV